MHLRYTMWVFLIVPYPSLSVVLWISMNPSYITIDVRVITTPFVRWVTTVWTAAWPTLPRQLYGYTIRP